jgi:ketosteroid isomerase-like protein
MKTFSHWKYASKIITVLALFLLAFPSCENNKSDSALHSSTLRLKQQADQWDRDIIRKDSNAIAANMSDDFRHIGKTGEVTDRNTFLHSIMSPDLVINPYTVEDFDIRIYGECALLCGRTKMSGTYQGKPFHSYYRYIDIYSRINGQWKVCNVQITGIPE